MPLDEALDFISDIGIKNIELTTDGGVHAYPYLISKPVNELIDLLQKKQIKCNILSGGWCDFVKGDFSLIPKQIEIARKLECKGIRFFPHNPHNSIEWNERNFSNLYQNVQKYASKYPDVNFLFENHGGIFKNITNISQFLSWVAKFNVNLVFDPANFMHDNIEPLEAIRTLWRKIYHVHVKDIKSDRKHFVVIGKGLVEWDYIVEILNNRNYMGDYSIELEGEYTNKEKEKYLAESVKILSEILNG